MSQQPGEHTKPSSSTREAEREEASAAHVADRAASPDEEQAADQAREDLSAELESVGEHYEEMTERGAHQEGEGRIA